MALNKKFFPKVSAGAAADTFTPSEHFNTVLYTGTGAAQRIGGYINRGAVFNGSSSIITITKDAFTTKNLFSVSFWVNTTSTTFSNLIGTGGYSSSNSGWTIYMSSSGYILFRGVNSTGAGYDLDATTNAINDGNWHNIVLTYTTNGNVNIYLDGSSLLTGTNTKLFTSYTNDLTVGYYNQSSPTGHLNGKLDQLRIFDKALSSSEVTTLYGETFASTTKSTTDIFDDDSAIALYQFEGNANDTGGVSGKYGAAAHFNGSNSDITINNFATLNQVGISMWVNIADVTSSYALITKYASNDREFSIYNYQASNGFIAALYYNGNNSNSITLTASDYLTNNTWHHIAYTADGSTQPKLYIDGVQRGTAGNNNNTYNSTSLPISLGSFGNSSYFLEGKIDEVRIYSDALTSTEIGYIYNNTTASIPTDNLEAYYKLDGDARDEQQLYDGTATNVTYAYDGTASNVTYQEATSFSPDLVWIKSRSHSTSHELHDSVRGEFSRISSDLTSAASTSANGFVSLTDNGFSLDGAGGGGEVNTSGRTYVAWCFNAGTDAAASNTDGDITSTVKANTAAGFSIVSYSGNNASSATIGHGLNSPPELIFTKARNFGAGWPTMVKTASASLYGLRLNSSSANDAGNGSVFYNNTAPTASVYTVGGSDEINDGYNYISYCFHSVDGYQKIGTYDGTGTSNGNFVETGFEPAFLMVKRTDGGAQNWLIFDNKRSTTNPRTKKLAPNLSSDENNSGTIGTDAQDNIDFYDNGFKPVTSNNHTNISGGTFIYLAIAADPDTTTPTVANSFDVVTYTGNASNNSVEVDFNGGLTWIKNRTDSNSYHILFDEVRGLNQVLHSNLTNAQQGSSNNFEYNNGTLSFDGNTTWGNKSGSDYVAWVWKAGDHDDNLPQINTEGTIDSIVSVNDEAGFSIVKYTGNGSNGATIGHGLSSAPEMIIIKNLSDSENWSVYGAGSASDELGETKVGHLNLSNAFSTSGDWNNTAPTSTVFTVGSSNRVNTTDNFVAYCWYSVEGYSKIGSYTGVTGNKTVTTNFRPRFLLIKNTSSAGNNWNIMDSTRDANNPIELNLWADTSDSEATASQSGIYDVDFNDDGFTIKNNFNPFNGNGEIYIYLAIK